MDDKKRDFKTARPAFNKLKVDPSSAAFAAEILQKKLLLNFKKLKYAENKKIFELVNFLDNKSSNVIF